MKHRNRWHRKIVYGYNIRGIMYYNINEGFIIGTIDLIIIH